MPSITFLSTNWIPRIESLLLMLRIVCMAVGMIGFANQDVFAQTAEQPNSIDEIVFAGSIADPTGNPVEGAKIFICFWYQQPLSAVTPHWEPISRTDALGQFRFTGRQLRDYGLWVEKKNSFVVQAGTLCAVKDGYALAWAMLAKFDTASLMYKSRLERHLKLSPDVRERMEQEDGPFEQRFKYSTEPLRLKPDDHPLEGRILNINGDPVPGAKVKLIGMRTGADETLDRWHEAIKADRADLNSTLRFVPSELKWSQAQSLLAPATTDAQGRFVLRGVGANRIVELQVEGQGIQTDRILVRTEPGDLIEIPNQFARGGESSVYYAAPLTHVVGPSQPIVGTVVDHATGQPIAGAVVLSQKRHGFAINGWGQDFIRTTTDAEGRYRLEGMPIGDTNRIGVIPPKDAPYLSSATVAKTSSRSEALEVDLHLFPGVWVTGRVIDKATGEGLPANITVFTFNDQPASKRGMVDERDYLQADSEGRFRVVAARGRGIIACIVDEYEKYPRGRGADKIKGGIGANSKTKRVQFPTGPMICSSPNFHALAELDPTPDADEIQLDFVLDAGKKVKGTVVDQAGEPVTTASFAGKLKETEGLWNFVESDGTFELVDFGGSETRRLTFFDRKRELAATVDVVLPLTEPLIVTLQPAGRVQGRVIDKDGEPLPNVQLTKWNLPSSIRGADDLDDVYSSSLPLPPTDLTRNRSLIQTDSNGMFELNHLVPGKEYRVLVIGTGRTKKAVSVMRVFGPLDVVIKVEPGQNLDLGDVTVANSMEFFEKFQAQQKAMTESSPKSND